MARLRYRPTSLILRTLFKTLGADLRSLLGWLGLCSLMLVGVWVWTVSAISEDKQHIRAKLHETAAADARAYAEQLERSLSQVDYIMLSQKYHYEKAGGVIDLEEQTRSGLVPPTSELIMTVVDADGYPITSTLPFKSNGYNIAERSYFLEHKQQADLGLTVSRPRMGLRLGREVIILTRRLDGRNGLFAGLIVVAIEPPYLGSRLGAESLEHDDLVAAYRTDWAFLAGDPQTADLALGARADTRAPFAGVAGTVEMAADHYRDGKVRILAWRKVKGYPLFAAVALSEASRLRAYGEREHEMRMSALFASLAVLLAAAGGTAWLLWNASKKLHRQEVRAAYRLATENADEGFFMLRPIYGPDKRIADFTVEDCNEYGAAAAGLARYQLIGEKLSTLRARGYMKRHIQACEVAMQNGSYEDVLRLPEPGTGSVRWMHRRFVRSGLGLAATIRDVSAARANEQKLQQQANIDALTSLPNRFWLMKHLPAALDEARSAGSMLAVLFIDLDDFKNLNDTQGHAAGDELLRAAARRLRGVLRQGDGVARLGGDEFTMILQAPGGDDEIATVARRVIEQLRQPFAVGDGRHVVSASVGISVFPRDGEDGAALLKHADIAMYAAKESGKSQYSFFHSRLSDRLVDRLTRQAELKRAVEQQDMVLYYQPRVDALTGELASMEALLRWIHPEHGVVGPDEFIPIAEETGLILPLGEQVIDMACRQLAAWTAAGARPVPVSVNVSPYQLERQDVAAVVAAALQRHAVEAALLEVEVTESATVQRGTAAAGAVAAIKALGVRLYVDDFGTGYSSLSQLKRLDMDGLKVDRAFTTSLTQGEEDVSLFRAIVSIGHAIGMTIVAEGVETAAQLAILQELGCDEVQGYYVSLPVPPSAALALLEKRFLFPSPAPGAHTGMAEVPPLDAP
jgi:diguanylate cyclase (GGDEF)-like protein